MSESPPVLPGFEDEAFPPAPFAEREEERLILDLSGVPDEQAFELIPMGVYQARVAETSFGYARSSGNPMVTAVLEITAGDYARRKLFYHMSYDPQAGADPLRSPGLTRLKRLLLRLAPEVNFRSFNLKTDHELLLGRRCQVKVRHRTWDGRVREEVADVLPAGEPAIGFLD